MAEEKVELHTAEALVGLQRVTWRLRNIARLSLGRGISLAQMGVYIAMLPVAALIVGGVIAPIIRLLGGTVEATLFLLVPLLPVVAAIVVDRVAPHGKTFFSWMRSWFVSTFDDARIVRGTPRAASQLTREDAIVVGVERQWIPDREKCSTAKWASAFSEPMPDSAMDVLSEWEHTPDEHVGDSRPTWRAATLDDDELPSVTLMDE